MTDASEVEAQTDPSVRQSLQFRWPSASSAGSASRVLPLALLGAICYLPLLFTAPGRVVADTKSYLYLDPGRLLSRAVSMWDPGVGLGTVTHQTIGYLFPIGPYYWLAEAAGIPDWVAQRLWLGSILFAAGAGVWFLVRDLGWRPAPAAVATFAYALTPYTLTLAARISVILLPFAGLPWMILFARRAIRRGGWRDPALFALVVLATGGVNATALVLAGVGPLLWFPHAVLVAREATARQALTAFARIGLLTVLTSLWWIAGLAVQGGYGIDILRYTETAETVAAASVGPEVMRSLGYWFFYGGDRLGPWIEPAASYTQSVGLLAVTYALPVLALAAAALTRWRHRAYFALLALAGAVLAVGAHPWDDPSPFGGAWKTLLLSDFGLALRSSPRAIPLLALGMAVLLGSGVAALEPRPSDSPANFGRKSTSAVPSRPKFGLTPARVAAVVIVALAIAGLPPLYTGGMVPENLERPEDIPGYWTDAAEHLDRGPSATRVLALPGTDFASYRWGNTVDPILPGLMDRPFVARELIPYGSPPSADLLIALDRRLQENVLEPEAIAPIARLMAVGDIVVRNDLEYERYRVARAYSVASLVASAPGLGEPRRFGPAAPVRENPAAPLLDELALGSRAATAPLHPVEVYPVTGSRPIVGTSGAGRPIVAAGSGEGIVAMAAAGLIDGTELIRYSAAMTDAELDDLSAAQAVLTDSNRRRGRRWSTIRDNTGFTERRGQRPLVADLSDNRLPVFGPLPGDPAEQSVAVVTGGVTAQATSYGNPTTLTPEYRPAMAVDGEVTTFWRTGPNRDVRGERLELSFDPPVTATELELVQLPADVANRAITAVDLVFHVEAGRTVVDRVRLGEESHAPGGRRVSFPERTFDRLEVVIRDDSSGLRSRPFRPARFTGLTSVGFAEVRVAGRTATEVVRLPRDLPTGLGRPLTILLERARSDPAERVRQDEERALARTWSLDDRRGFSVDGTARISALVPDEVIDRIIDPDASRTVRSSRRLHGSLAARGSSAFDADPTTAWMPAMGSAEDWIEIELPEPVSFDRVALTVLADGRHSIPAQLAVTADGGEPVVVDVPAVSEHQRAGPEALSHVELRLPRTISGGTLRFTVLDVHERTTIEWFSSAPLRLPVAIVEIEVPGVPDRPVDGGAAVDTGCRRDLLHVNGEPVPVRVVGTVGDAVARAPLDVRGCELLELDSGSHVLTAGAGSDTGIDVDRLVLSSGPQGAAAAFARLAAPPAGPEGDVADRGGTRYDVVVRGATAGEPFWLVLGQSNNAGWSLEASGATASERALVNGYANGWKITPDRDGAIAMELEWTPQRWVTIALVVSALGALVCLVLVLAPRRRRGPDVPESGPVMALDAGAPVDAIRAIVVGLVAGAVGVVFIGALAGLVVGAVAGAAARWRAGRLALVAATPGALAVAAAYVIARQIRYRPAAAFEWPAEQASAHQIALASLGFLVALVIVDAARERRARAASRPTTVPRTEPGAADDAVPGRDGE